MRICLPYIEKHLVPLDASRAPYLPRKSGGPSARHAASAAPHAALMAARAPPNPEVGTRFADTSHDALVRGSPSTYLRQRG